MALKKSNVLTTFINWRDFRLKIFFEGIFIGLAAGIAVVLFRYMLEQAELLRQRLYVVLEMRGIGLILLWFAALFVIGCLLYWLVQKEPMASGSGIPQVKGTISGHFKMNWLRVLGVKFIGGVLAIGAGLSLGREGPSIQLGAAMGQGVSRLLGRLKIEERYLMTSGASAGLAAAFNAPLAGVMFALEELHKSFSPAVLMSAMAASLTADLVARESFGQKPIFHFPSLPVLPLKYYIYLVGLGLVCGVLGVIFNRALIKALNIYSEQRWLPRKFVPVFPLMIGGILGFVLPEVLGGGNGLVDLVAQGRFSLVILAVLLVGKFLFTMVSYGSGVPGGIFLPMLVLGALAGGIYGNLMTHYLHINPHYINDFVVLAMAAYFTAVVKAPVTGSILITEMTGSFQHLPGLITVSMTAYLVSDLLKSQPIYETLLARILAKKSPDSLTTQEAGKIIIEEVVCLGSGLAAKRVKDIAWPPHCLLVGIKRGEKEIIPKGNTKILAGDFLYVLANEDEAAEIKDALSQMAAH
ncbi:H(+)/Cl(-) exchange transporter ClcA [Desulfotomaculum nigrificans]|uniref:H(+)/Cl(-) exchange transporter ClcA n=1 Tax=Desulfotomaculum nigrificans TaxID=1565 RepID=UPI0001FAE585|nr:H(+)/Cl(-) exchange transporter ClcA [Desulfotomaculum nigrificans]